MSYELSRLWRRVWHAVRLARTTLPTVETGVVQTVQAQYNKRDVHTAVVGQLTGFASALPVGTDIVVLNMGGDNTQSVAIASNHQRYRPKGMQTGETCIYDMQTVQQSILLRQDGTVVINGFHDIIISCDTSISITAPTVTIHGDLHVTGAVVAGSGGSDQVALQTHRHGADSHGDSVPGPIAGT